MLAGLMAIAVWICVASVGSDQVATAVTPTREKCEEARKSVPAEFTHLSKCISVQLEPILKADR